MAVFSHALAAYRAADSVLDMTSKARSRLSKDRRKRIQVADSTSPVMSGGKP
jgi:hypothetical protein